MVIRVTEKISYFNEAYQNEGLRKLIAMCSSKHMYVSVYSFVKAYYIPC